MLVLVMLHNTMESYDFFFEIELGRIGLNRADNLSAALQGSIVSASEGQSLISQAVATLKRIRSEEDCSNFRTRLLQL